MSYSLTLYERETIINFNEAEATANIYTHNIALRNKLLKLSQSEPDLRIVRHGEDMLEVEVPKKWIRVSPPKKLSTEYKQKLADLMRTNNLAKSEKSNTKDKIA